LTKKSLTFFDVKSKKSFKTSKYKIIKKKSRGSTVTMARAKSPYSGKYSYRILYRGKKRGKG